MDETNERVADIIIEKFSDLLAQTEMVENERDLKKALSKNKMFRNDLKNFVGSVTPYVPYIGLISGLLTVAGNVFYENFKTPEGEEEPNEGSENTKSEGKQSYTERSEVDEVTPKPARQKTKQTRKPRAPKEPKQPSEAPQE